MKKTLILLIIALLSFLKAQGQINMNFILVVNDTIQEEANIQVEVEYKNGKRKTFFARYMPGNLSIKELQRKELPKIKKIHFRIETWKIDEEKIYEFTTGNPIILVESISYFFDISYIVLFFYDLKTFPDYKPQDPHKDYVTKVWYPAMHTILLKKTNDTE